MGEMGYGTREPLVSKLKQLANDIQGVYEEFLDAETLFEQGRISEKDFFKKLGSFMKAFSSLGFLTVKVVLEINNAIGEDQSKKTKGGTKPSATLTPSMMGGTSTPQFGPEILGKTEVMAKVETAKQELEKGSTKKLCSECNEQIPAQAKFCTRCGAKQ